MPLSPTTPASETITNFFLFSFSIKPPKQITQTNQIRGRSNKLKHGYVHLFRQAPAATAIEKGFESLVYSEAFSGISEPSYLPDELGGSCCVVSENRGVAAVLFWTTKALLQLFLAWDKFLDFVLFNLKEGHGEIPASCWNPTEYSGKGRIWQKRWR
ncbi:PREDICTED: uncharacterized protein LOC101298833 [Fragaria vesca subsp. vesca]|uniref:uncharacterized protein LOC101298833 n=1 Tax=Fragaria vesca subsp. vesca TaxID=101020 RepID=UPI0002C2E122|nr:PREDICTED: uncharacterized protein LOC101298833 [Fragaria vesca subsp. vesca]